MSRSFQFLLALLWVVCAAARELGPFAGGALLLSRRAAVEAGGSRGLRCAQGLRLGLGLGLARSFGVEPEPLGGGRGGGR